MAGAAQVDAIDRVGSGGIAIAVDVEVEAGLLGDQLAWRQQRAGCIGAAAVQLPAHRLERVAVAPVEGVAAAGGGGGHSGPAVAGAGGGGVDAGVGDLNRRGATRLQGIALAGAAQVDAVDRDGTWRVGYDIVIEDLAKSN